MSFNDDFKAVISIGMRCYTEIFIKKIGFKKFSAPFDAIFSNKIDDIIYLFENKIKYDELIHTENIDNRIIKELNSQFGLRTIHRRFNYYNENDYYNTFHKATFAHHNLNDINVKNHFDRCFNRLDLIQKNKIKTLFCLFIHPHIDMNISYDEINKLNLYLCNKYNCHLLVINFHNYSDNFNDKMQIHIKNDTLTYIYVNNRSCDYRDQAHCLKYIFDTIISVKENKLLTYQEINDLK